MDYYSRQVTLLDSELDVNIVKYTHSQLAIKALLKEICLSPKPGLVDMYNNGSHHDMNFATFIASIKAISLWFDEFYHYGQSCTLSTRQDFLTGIRPIGIECELAMYHCTNHVNTHKGGIFAFGLLLGAIGRLVQQRQHLNYQTICNEVANICQGMVSKELKQHNLGNSVGEKLFTLYQLSGARGEAESGYLTVRKISLPIFTEMLNSGYDEETSLLQAMLYLLAYNKDTNLVSRGGLSGLHFVQEAAKKLIRLGGVCHKNGRQHLYELDTELIKRNLSPGGTADMIAITWFLSQYQ